MKIQSRHDITLVELDNQGILFCEGHQSLYALDTLAASLWRATAGASAKDDLIRFLVLKTGLPLSRAESYLTSCLRQWNEAGLLHRGECILRSVASPVLTHAPPTEYVDDVFGLAGFKVGVSYGEPGVATAVRDVFGHLGVKKGTTDFAFRIVSENGAYRLLGPDSTDHLLPDSAAVAVWLKTEILDALLRRSPDTMAIHAAALKSPKGTMLLAGPSRCGKTTLAALLNTRGWPSIADDVMLIDSQKRSIRGLPLAYAVKPGSWPIIRRSAASLDALATHTRPDGRVVKYLIPTSIAAVGSSVGASIVFPCFSQRASTALIPVSRVAALVRILSEARNTSHHLTTEAFLTVATILRQALVQELRFSSANEAVDALMQQ
jgi:hypothetical protein